MHKRRPNRLINSKSPYLLKHAYNPVDWYPWGEEAISRAKREDKPIFLSIGYSACHWCNVMEKETFEDDRIAMMLNENFICIKVDREEHPEVDEVYMKAVQLMTGQGGWPLTVFLTPDLEPFFGGTYFPPTRRMGMIGFDEVLHSVISEWKNRKKEIRNYARQVKQALSKLYEKQPYDGNIAKDLLDVAFDQLVSQFDAKYGGFGISPKFPMPTYMLFLMRYYSRVDEGFALTMVKKTLDSMAKGGIYDHLGGGFHRYSTDRYWLVPHFEKMLYDNALIARSYLEAYQVTGEEFYVRVAKETLDWVLREMTSPEGGFYSSQDADSEGEEGAFYTWKLEEINSILDQEEAKVISDHLGITYSGNFEGRKNVLHVALELEKLASKHNKSINYIANIIDKAKKKLLEVRQKREKPLTDDKILTSWNGLMISTMSYAYQVTGDQKYIDAAINATNFINSNLRKNGSLLRRYREGESMLDGNLEDYSFFVWGLLDLYESTFDISLIDDAIELTESMISKFWDEKSGGFFMNAEAERNTIMPIKEAYDGPVPSGNSVATLNLLRLYHATLNKRFLNIAERTFKSFLKEIRSYPSNYTLMLCGIDFYLGPVKEIVILGRLGSGDTNKILTELRKRFVPRKVVLFSDSAEITKYSMKLPIIEGKSQIDKKATVYVCENYRCEQPITNPSQLSDFLSD